MKALIGSVGYFNLTDLSAGPHVVEALQNETLASGVDVCDLSYGGPIGAVHRLNETKPPYERLVFVGGVENEGGEAGYRWYRWTGKLPPPDEVQARVAEAVSGVLDLLSFPIVCQQFQALPEDVWIVEIDALDCGHGLEPSAPMKKLLPEICALVRRLAEEEDA